MTSDAANSYPELSPPVPKIALMPSTASPSPGKSLAGTIFLSWLIAGTLDICAAFLSAFVKSGAKPGQVLRYVASGVFGRDAFKPESKAMMSSLGLLFHFLIALSFTLFFYWIYPRLKLQRLNQFLLALIYGLFVWTIMNRVIIPFTNTPGARSGKFDLNNALLNMLILVICIGLPLSLMARKYYLYKK